jgi:hypothetical protein
MTAPPGSGTTGRVAGQVTKAAVTDPHGQGQ